MKPHFSEVGRQFVQMYYNLMETNRNNLAAFYNNESIMTFENGIFYGQQQIMEKLLNNPSARYSILTCDCQPSPNNGVVVFTMGDVSLDNSPPMKFAHIVQLFPNGNSYFVLNDVFRLCIG